MNRPSKEWLARAAELEDEFPLAFAGGLAAWLGSRTCACPHPDPIACAEWRSPPGREIDPDDRCECGCHERDEIEPDPMDLIRRPAKEPNQ